MSDISRKNPQTSKSLYTPVLYGHVPESSESSTGVGPCSTYLKRLTREHLARASMEENEPSMAISPPSKSKARVAQLTKKVRRAFVEANGNPADGRWAFVADLLQMHCTRGGRRWIGVNLDSQAPEIHKHLCPISKTSEEWQELERRIKVEEEVNSKVQRWIRSAEFKPLSPDVTVDQDQVPGEATLHPPSISKPREKPSGSNVSAKITQMSLKTGFSASNPLSSGFTFGFNVVKRPNFIKNGKKPGALSSTPPPEPVLPSTADIPESLSPPAPHNDIEPSDETGHPSTPVPCISTVSSGNVRTSTPLPKSRDKVQDSGPSFKSPSVAPESANLPHNPDKARYEGDMSLSNRKRARSQSPELAVFKRARTAVEGIGRHSAPPPQFEVAEFLVTPSTIRSLPRLTELLGLSPCQKRNTPRKQTSKSPVALPTSIHSSVARDHSEPSTISTKPQAKDPIGASAADDNSLPAPISETPSNALASGASTIKAPEGIAVKIDDGDLGDPQQVAVELGSEADDVDPSIIEEVLKVQKSQPHTSTPPSSPQSDQFRFPSVDLEVMTSKLDTTTYNLYGLDDDLESSPAKSLSSLAGSDSESDEAEAADQNLEKIKNTVPRRLHHLVDSEFNPQFTSTQKPGLEYNLASNTGLSGHTTSENLPWGNEKLSSTSQLQAEVNSQVNEFDKFMEADLAYDQVIQEL